ncbi:hypothetical protein CEXT_279011 [Caerostris extrusa]|uniref:Uncharacterized protein n=1 Tax=Caerostris extrusa TaxID=172846 RepID=A0AAV4U1A2_CAEEX|nr:hypothetical protein CEXT_279011 [Caerostris extrusa]
MRAQDSGFPDSKVIAFNSSYMSKSPAYLKVAQTCPARSFGLTTLALEEKRRAKDCELEKRKIGINFELESSTNSVGDVADNVLLSSNYSENKIEDTKK